MNEFENNIQNDDNENANPVTGDFSADSKQQSELDASLPSEDTAHAFEEKDTQPQEGFESSQIQENPTQQNAQQEAGNETFNCPDGGNADNWKKIEYTPVLPITDRNPMSRGLRIFSAVLASVILLTCACTVGYFAGRKSVIPSRRTHSEIELAARPEDTDPYTAAQVYERVNKSVVGICVYNEAGTASYASGVIYSEDGYIITNDHIYSEIGAPKFRVYDYNGKEYTASYIAGDSVSDLAVLKVDGAGFEVAEFGDSADIFFGENVVAIGRPSDATDDSSITSGIISLPKRRVKTTSNYSASLIQTDSAINPGSSGGALVNMYGQIIGITSSKLAGVQYDSVGFAIPTVTVKRVAEQLISQGKVTDRAKLGITYTEVNSVTAEVQGLDSTGLYIVSVSEDSDIYGKVKEGDMIVSVNGISITRDDTVLDIIEECRAGDMITLTIVTSDGTTADYKVTLKANVGESSYKSTIENSIQQTPSDDSSSDGTFNFPFGE